jgi:hypothetical protein
MQTMKRTNQTLKYQMPQAETISGDELIIAQSIRASTISQIIFCLFFSVNDKRKTLPSAQIVRGKPKRVLVIVTASSFKGISFLV